MNKKVKINTWISSIILALALVACQSYDEPNVSKDSNDVYMSFETSFLDDANNDTRALGWTAGGMNNLPIANLNQSLIEATLPAIIVIKNKPRAGSPQRIYYLEQDFHRTSSGSYKIGTVSNTDEVQLGADMYGEDIKLNRTDEWYMMAYFKGEWNRDDKTMSYEPIKNKWINYKKGQRVIVTRNAGQTVGSIDQPMILPWTKMALRNESNGKVRFSPDDNSPVSRITAMGTIITARFTNTVNALRSVIRVKIYSNVLTTKKGFYNLANDRLPALPINGSTTINYPEWSTSEQVNASGYYDSDYLEMINNWGGGGWHTPNLSANGSEYQYYPMIWAMPMPLTSGTPRTELRAQIGLDRPGTTGVTRRQVAYESILWNSSTMPKNNSSIGILATVTDSRIQNP